MKAVVFEQFSTPPTIQQVPDPTPEPHGVVVKVMANGVCRSDSVPDDLFVVRDIAQPSLPWEGYFVSEVYSLYLFFLMGGMQ